MVEREDYMIKPAPPLFEDVSALKHPFKFRERNKKIRALRRQRYTLQEIANLYGITHQRVAAICKGVIPRSIKNTLD